MAGEADRIGPEARAAITGGETVVVSAAVIWEIEIKRQLGKLDAPSDLLEKLEGAGVSLLPISARHANRVGTLPTHHRNPFDRLLVAQAEIEGYRLISADATMRSYDIEVLW